MATHPQRANDLLVSANFIRAIREAGYVNIRAALAELIDNALEANAREIAVTISRSASRGLPQIEVEDNGIKTAESTRIATAWIPRRRGCVD
jgi:signal transduction histidine kinase